MRLKFHNFEEKKEMDDGVGRREIGTISYHFRVLDGKLDVNAALGGCNLTVTQRFA